MNDIYGSSGTITGNKPEERTFYTKFVPDTHASLNFTDTSMSQIAQGVNRSMDGATFCLSKKTPRTGSNIAIGVPIGGSTGRGSSVVRPNVETRG